MLERLPDLAAEVATAARDRLPGYGAIPFEQHAALTLRVGGVVLSTILIEHRATTPEELAAFSGLVEDRARQGVSLDSLLLAMKLGMDVAWPHVLDEAHAEGIEASTLLELTRIRDEHLAALTDVMVASFRRAEAEDLRLDEQSRTRLLSDLLMGARRATLVADAAKHGVTPARSYHAWRARPASDDESRAMMRTLDTPRGNLLIAGPIHGDVGGLVLAAPTEAVDVAVGLGPAAAVLELAASFTLATRALDAATAFGMRGAISMDDLGPLAAVASDPATGLRLFRRYLEPLLAQGPVGRTLVETVKAYVDNGLRTDRTAAALYVHTNTLRDRLRRFEKATGANLGSTRDVVSIWWALAWEGSTLGAAAGEGSPETFEPQGRAGSALE